MCSSLQFFPSSFTICAVTNLFTHSHSGFHSLLFVYICIKFLRRRLEGPHLPLSLPHGEVIDDKGDRAHKDRHHCKHLCSTARKVGRHHMPLQVEHPRIPCGEDGQHCHGPTAEARTNGEGHVICVGEGKDGEGEIQKRGSAAGQAKDRQGDIHALLHRLAAQGLEDNCTLINKIMTVELE